MRIALAYPAMNLVFRGSLELASAMTDPRGLTGSEYGFLRLDEELRAAGHDVTLFVGEPITGEWDAAVAINDPNVLRDVKALVRVCEFYMNDFGFCRAGFEQHVDLFHSPSAPHMRHMLSREWPVEITSQGPAATVRFRPEQWAVNELGCDPERFGGEKIPGRVIYASSPDRGLHWLLQEWPAIKRAVPHASLRIFYRLGPWLQDLLCQPPFHSIWPLQQRASYIADALHRLKGLDVVAVDSVSREQIAREMSQAEVLAYPCDTVAWSEGFSCTILEACAARACPVITDCDALGELYTGAVAVTPRNAGWVRNWEHAVVACLQSAELRRTYNDRAEAFAKERTWKRTAQRLDRDIKSLWESRSSTSAGSSRTSAKSPSEASRSSSAEPTQSGPTTTIERTGTDSTWSAE